MEIKALGNTNEEYIRSVLEEHYSNNNNDLDKVIQKIKDHQREESLRAVSTAGAISRYNGKVIDCYDSRNDFAKNVNLVKYIIGMGHESIIEHDYMVVAVQDVSPIIEQILIGHRLASFTVKSRREVDYSKPEFYLPNFHVGNQLHPENNHLLNEYDKHERMLFDTYSKFVDSGIKKEDARFILPYSFYSNLVMGMNARECIKVIAHCLYSKDSKITEVYEFGLKFKKIALEQFPYLEKNLEDAKKNYESQTDFQYEFADIEMTKLEKPEITDMTIDLEHKILASAVMQSRQCNYSTAMNHIKNLSANEKSTIMRKIFLKPENRELEQISFQIQMPVSLPGLTHVTRHRMHSLLIPDFTPLMDFDYYITPPSIAKNHDALYQKTVEQNKRMMELFKAQNVRDEDLVYFYLSAQKMNITTTMNGSTLAWFIRMRACLKTQWEIRAIAQYLKNEIQEVYPIYGLGLGPTCETHGDCPEGKECCGKIKSIECGSLTLTKNSNF